MTMQTIDAAILPPTDQLIPPGGHPGLVDRHEAAKLLDMSGCGMYLWMRKSTRPVRRWRGEGRKNLAPVYFAIEDLHALRAEMEGPRPEPAPYDGPADAPLPPEGTTVAPGYPGLVTKEQAAAMFGVAENTLSHWQLRVERPLRRWGQKTPYGPPLALFAIEDVRGLRRAIEELAAPYDGPADAPLPKPGSAVRPGYPGLATQAEAAAMFDISVHRWIEWQRSGLAPKRRWYQVGSQGPRAVLFARVDLERLRTDLDSYFGPYTGPMDAPLPKKGERVQAGHPGLLTRHEAAKFMDVPFTTWHWWERERTVPKRRWRQRARNCQGAMLYAVEDLAIMREELRKRREPHPDPERPGVWRVPISSTLHTMDALIDERDLPVVQGKAWHWSPRDEGGGGEVVLAATWGTGPQPPLKRLILGVEGRDNRVLFRNGDPLDCRRENLLMVGQEEQSRRNRKMRHRSGKACSSKFKGVCWCEERGKWLAQIVRDGRHRHLGRFDDEELAARAYDKAARELFGELARLNFLEPSITLRSTGQTVRAAA
jgi:hypothetical protein